MTTITPKIYRVLRLLGFFAVFVIGAFLLYQLALAAFRLLLTLSPIIIAVLVWGIISSFRDGAGIVKDKEIGLLITLWRPRKTVEHGPHLIFWPLTKIVKYPTTTMVIPLPEIKVTSAPGDYESRYYGAEDLTIRNAALEIQYPQDKDLIQTHFALTAAPGDEKKLAELLGPAVAAALSGAFASITWRQAYKDRATLIKEAEETLRSGDNIFKKAGFRDEHIHLQVPNITLPQELLGKMQEVDVAELDVGIAEKKAKALGMETTGSITRMIATATGKSLSDVQKDILQDSRLQRKVTRDSLDILHRKIAAEHGGLLDIRVQGARGMDKSLLNLAGVFSKIFGHGISEPESPSEKHPRMKSAPASSAPATPKDQDSGGVKPSASSEPVAVSDLARGQKRKRIDEMDYDEAKQAYENLMGRKQ